MSKKWKLCYCEGHWAWFTTNELDKQWGDDWNDAPWEHNAGEPYSWGEWMEKRGVEKYELMILEWYGPYDLPGRYELNSKWSVQDINRGDVAWLIPMSHAGDNVKPIDAGCSPEEFMRTMNAAGGVAYNVIDERNSIDDES